MSSQDENRPDRLLSLIQRSEPGNGEGRLKVFLGMVAGVGKTFAMLQRAHQLKSQGVDVVVGLIDTHGRAETAKLLEGLEVVPRKKITHRGVELWEMDLDAILQRRPKVALVDELAHTNAPGSRHEKRYLDVQELLRAGIDIFTAVNIQHIESRVDTVREITGITVQETVPDSILDAADEVVLIDLPPDDLLLRLKEGRIYPPERADMASHHFFQRGNLTALRELALRSASDRVDRDLRDFKTLHGIDRAWKSSSRLMVGVFGSPYSEALIRWTRQLSETMRGTWIGVYVDTGRPQSAEEQALLERNTALVRRIGGEFIATQDQSLVEGLLRVARQNNVTQIIVGKTHRHSWTNRLQGGSVVQKLLLRSGDIDVYAVAASREKTGTDAKLPKPVHQFLPANEIGWLTAAVLMAWAAASGLVGLLGYESIGILFLMVVTLGGLVFSRTSIFVLAALLSLIHNFFFIPPVYDFAIQKPQDVLMLLMFFLAASAIGRLTSRLRRQNSLIVKRELRSTQLYRLAQRLSEARDVSEVVQAGVDILAQDFDAAVAVMLCNRMGELELHPNSSFAADAKERAVAEWSRQNKTQAGRFTDTLLSSYGTYFPLTSQQTVLGVVGLCLPPEANLNFENRSQIQNLVEQLASAVEREQLHESRRLLSNLEQAERLYRSLFDSVSHELKTPLTTIQGAASVLSDPQASSTPECVRELSAQVGHETDRMLGLVNNMLDMTRLESGAVKAKISLCDVADVIGPALARAKELKTDRILSTKIETGVRSLYCDSALLVQALLNIIKNALVYTRPQGHIVIRARNFGENKIEIAIEDDGPGLPQPNPNVVFDRFYRENPRTSGGVGLGLSIARGFVEAQGGKLEASNRAEGGARFTLWLPSGQKDSE